jgi:hypothetical protein
MKSLNPLLLLAAGQWASFAFVLDALCGAVQHLAT